MILNEQFISEIHHADGQLNDQYILEIEEDDAEEILNVFMKLIFYFSKYQVNDKEFLTNLEMIKFSEKRRDIFFKKLEENQKDLRKTFQLLNDDVTPQYKNLKWRYDIQVSSKTFEEETKPKITLLLELQQGLKQQGHFIQTDYANLKHLHEELQLAIKAHDSIKQKKTQKLFI